jgi:alkylation response protein AidB-like acyl-CoA dehydrogenase
MDRLGVTSVEPEDDIEALAAAAVFCRVAGEMAVPYPVTAALVRVDPDDDAVALVDPRDPLVDHGDVHDRWRVVAFNGDSWRGTPVRTSTGGSRMGRFVVPVRLGEPLLRVRRTVVALCLVFDAWRVLGTLSAALNLTKQHVGEREQFGAPLSRLQAVQFAVADAIVSVDGFEELAKYTLWRLATSPADSLVDALALRVVADNAARLVLRISHQLHGATGFCDEYNLSVLSLHAQPLLRLPCDSESTLAAFEQAVGHDGFASLFG